MDFFLVSEARTILFVYLSFGCLLVMCQDAKNDKDIMAAINHAHKVNAFSQKYLKSSNQNPLNDVFMYDANEIIARAEELLVSDFGAEAEPNNNVSSTCMNDTTLFVEALSRGEQWALKMLDAMGKPASGILEGNMMWPGSYDECLAVEAVMFGNGTSPTYPYTGQYCKSSYIIGAGTSLLSPVAAITIGICFPSSCSESDAKGLSTRLLSLIPGVNMTTMPQPYVTCQKKSLDYDSKAIAVIVVCSLFLTIMTVATVYDIAIVYWWSKVVSKEKEYLPTDYEYGSIPPPVVGNGLVADDTSPLLRHSENHVTQNGVLAQNGYGAHHQSDVKKVNLDGKHSKYQPDMLGQALLAFSVYTNASKILGTSQPSGTLTAVNGIRFISMTWVILGHTYGVGLQEVANIAVFLPAMLKRFTFQAIDNATVAVDTFFVLSGLLVAYLSLKEMKKRGGMFKFNWGLYYFHRFWRLTPPYMLWLMVYVVTFKYWSNGPMWSQTGVEIDECSDTWWKNLLYINNLYEPTKQCMAWSWYLANDMQFFVISPLLLIPLYYSPLWGCISCLAFILVNFISAGAISSHYDLQANGLFDQAAGGVFFEKLYITPWCRIGPYIIGFFTGYLLYITDCKVKMSKAANIFGWVTATAAALLTLYGLYSSDGVSTLSVGVSSLYNATARTAWGMAISWVIFACATGYGGPVNALLSWQAIVPLSRLTYCAYLVHPVVMYTYYMSRHTLMYWYDLEIMYLFLGHTCLAYAVAFVVSLAFESPMMGLEKVLLGRVKNS